MVTTTTETSNTRRTNPVGIAAPWAVEVGVTIAARRVVRVGPAGAAAAVGVTVERNNGVIAATASTPGVVARKL